ncbi:MAG TPA: GtrA family protein [Burkholderiales bacterium]|nr:GtrA family protein [Burkholderiales bacterium]
MTTAAISRQFVLFLIAGGVAALANYCSRFAFSLWFDYATAIVLAYCVGMAVAFVLMRQIVFSGTGKALWPQIWKFVLVNLLAVAQTLVVSLVLAWWLLPAIGVREHVEALAHAVGVMVPIFTSFLGHRMATFK